MRTINNILILAALCLMLSCKKEAPPEIKDAAIFTQGHQTLADLHNIIPTTDGGFIVAAHSRKNGNKEIWITKFDQNVVLQWQRFLGGNLDNRLDKVFIDKEDNILLAGFAYGFGEENYNLDRLHNWIPYFHMLNPDGTTKWELGEYYYPTNSDHQRVTNIIQDDEGEYLVSGHIYNSTKRPDGTIVFPALRPALVQISKDGHINAVVSFVTTNPLSAIDAVYSEGDNYTVIGRNLATNNDDGEVLKFDRNDLPSIYTNQLIDSFNWPQSIDLSKRRILNLQNESTEFLESYHFYNDEAYRIQLERNSSKVAVGSILQKFSDIQWVHRGLENQFILLTTKGKVFETDFDLDEKNSFELNYQISRVCALKNGRYTGALVSNNTFTIVIFNDEGEISIDE